MNFHLGQDIGRIIDSIINWIFTFKDNDIQMLIWGGLVAALLVFIIEYLRKPKILLSFLDCGFDFNLPICRGGQISYPESPNSKNWKLEVKYKKSIWNKLLFRYPLSNLKVKISLFDSNLSLIRNFQAKPDFNPNVYQERDIPSALIGISLTKGEKEMFPIINKNDDGWLAFEVWEIFFCENRKFLPSGQYFIKAKIISDQSQGIYWSKLVLNSTLNFYTISFIEKLKLAEL